MEWSGAVAKGATIDLVVTQQTTTNDAIYDSSQYVINNLTAPVLSIEHGWCYAHAHVRTLPLGNERKHRGYNNLW